MRSVSERDGDRPPRAGRRWRRPALYASVGVVLLAVVAGWFVWTSLRQTHTVSVGTSVSRYRSATASPAATAPADLPRPATGVYVYATSGSERISIGGLSHRYPARTTLTVTNDPCGLRVRWDALAERWSEWLLCATEQGWRLHTATDMHKFLYREDRQDYLCDDTLALPARLLTSWTTTCHTESGQQLTVTATKVGAQVRQVGGQPVATTRLHAVTHASGASVNDGTVEMWLADSTGLPVRAEVRNHGTQQVLGQKVTYDETATFDLTSLTPSR